VAVYLRSALFWLALILITPPYALIALASAPLPRVLRYRVISGWSRLVIWCLRTLCGIDWRIEGGEHLPAAPAVILAKHQSAWETLAFQQIFPPQVHVLKRELLWIPFFGWGLALMSPIPIDRGRGMSALRQIARRGKRRLEQGFWVVVFPEGTRVAPGSRRKYQTGGAWLAAHAGAPVVPVAHNAGRYWPRNSFLKYPGTVTVRIGPAIESAGRDPETINAMAEQWIETQQQALDSGR
jgi:1-acyl-sn-glycerol-3-phosphate acyltransferase